MSSKTTIKQKIQSQFNTTLSENSVRIYKQPHFMIIPSMSCQASCSYCFGPHHGPIMNPEIVSKVIEYIVIITSETVFNNVKITFHGGEPLLAGYEILNNFLSRFTSVLYRKKLEFGIQSNLWLLDNELCALFKKHNVDIGTSLDGPADITDLQRGKGYFEKTFAGIQKARMAGLSVGCIATFTADSVHRWREVFDFFISNRLDFSIHTALPTNGTKHFDYSLTPSEYGSLLCEMFDYYIKYRKEISVSTLDQIIKSFVKNSGQVCTFRDCTGMFIAIDALGDIYPCQRFCGNIDFKIGSIYAMPQLEDLDKKNLSGILAQHRNKILEQCKDCNHFNYCKGGCPYSALSCKPNVTFRDPYCEAYKEVFDFIQKRLIQEMTSEENILRIVNNRSKPVGNPLLRKGALIELAREGLRPKEIARNAKRIIAAVELTKISDINLLSLKLNKMGICNTVHSATVSLKKLKERLFPTQRILNNVYLHITYNCQLNCDHCYACSSHFSNKLDEMAIKNIDILISDAQKMNFNKFVITGGEPLVYSDRTALLKMLKKYRVQKNHIKIILRTNFSMPLADLDLSLIASSFDEVVVSIDGNKASHDARRGKGSYEMIINNLTGFCKIQANIVNAPLISIASALDADEIYGDQGNSVRHLAARFNIDKIRFKPILPLGRAKNMKNLPLAYKLGRFVNKEEFVEKGYIPVASCGLGKNIYIAPSGETYPCHALYCDNFFLGNVISEGFETIVNSKKLTALANYNVNTNIKCKKCHVRYLCGGSCVAWNDNKGECDLGKANFECEELKEAYNELYREAMKYLEN